METINQTETTRTDVCPNCGAESQGQTFSGKNTVFYCGAIIGETKNEQSRLCIERKARQKAQAEVERLRELCGAAIDAIDRWEEKQSLQAKYSEIKLSNPLY